MHNHLLRAIFDEHLARRISLVGSPIFPQFRSHQTQSQQFQSTGIPRCRSSHDLLPLNSMHLQRIYDYFSGLLRSRTILDPFFEIIPRYFLHNAHVKL